MKNDNIKVILIFSILFIVFCSCNSSSKIPKFDHYGVFVEGKEGFKEVKGYYWDGWDQIYKNSRNYDRTPILLKDEFVIYVYSSKAKLSEYNLIIADLSYSGDFDADGPEVDISIQPIKKKDDMIKITAQTNGGIFILQDKSAGKGYFFSAGTDSFYVAFKKAEIEKNKTKLEEDYKNLRLIAKKIASEALAYYKTPKAMGGGEGSFESVNLESWCYFPSNGKKNIKGREFIIKRINKTEIKIIGIGKTIGNDGINNTKITTIVNPNLENPISTSIDN